MSTRWKTQSYEVSRTERRGRRRSSWGSWSAGWLVFEFVPDAMDSRLGTFDAWGMSFFITAAMLFINIHHYFIDNVLWRFKDPHVRAYLLGDVRRSH